jgi:hypothetical protein
LLARRDSAPFTSIGRLLTRWRADALGDGDRPDEIAFVALHLSVAEGKIKTFDGMVLFLIRKKGTKTNCRNEFAVTKCGLSPDRRERVRQLPIRIKKLLV